MRQIELAKGIYSSAIGFGCAPVMGSVGSKVATRALHCALDNGITHFDLARSYGFGDAEHFVGNVLKSRRNDVVLVSKFGIKANWKAKLLTPAKPLIRLLKGKVSKPVNSPQADENKQVQTVADRFHNRITINAKEMRQSLEKSLKELNTHYLDHFLVHEPLDVISNIDDLMYAAEKMKEEGKIRSFGLAFNTQSEALHQNYLGRFDLLQFNKPATNDSYNKWIKERGKSANILFSVIRNKPAGITIADWLKQLSNDFPKSVLLLSMFNEEHIKQNAGIFL